MNNGENQTNTTTNNGVNSAPIANEKTTAGIQAMHPQALAASGAQKEQVLATIQAAGVEQAPVVEEKKEKKEKVKKPANNLARFFFLIILLLCGGCFYLWTYHQNQMNLMNEKCTPISTKGEEKELELSSNIVKDLYSLVKTDLKEDIGQSELNDELKLYLAFRQVSHNEFCDSHCKSFTNAGIEPFTCEESSTFVPKAVKASVVEVEYRKLFGFDASVPHGNVQLGNTCVGGYQYIESRGEYVQGNCGNEGATFFQVDKELTSAYSKGSTIALRERVKYYGSEGLEVPDRLVSGTYEYLFKLDMNYNYVYVSKTLLTD